MNETMTNFWPRESIGLPLETIMALSPKARHLYDLIYDYCTYASDPQYRTLHRFRNQIAQLDIRDRDILISYFNADPAIADHNMKVPAWDYFADPY